MTRATFVVETLAAPSGAYSHGASFGPVLCCAGQLGRDPQAGGALVTGVGAQARQALANLEAICRADSASLDDALLLTVYVRDLDGDGPRVDEAIAERFPQGPPARATVGVAALPAGGLVEIAAIVARSSHGDD